MYDAEALSSFRKSGQIIAKLRKEISSIVKPGKPALKICVEIESRIREANPEVVRTEELVKRRSDGKLLARSVSYSRRGGDFPTGLAHDSLFSCPQQAQLSKQIFKLKEEAK